MSSKVIQISNNGITKKVALYSGLEVNELNGLLQTIFELNDNVNIIGLQTDDDLIIPLSLICKSPDSINGGSICTLLIRQSSKNPTSTGVTPSSNQQQTSKPTRVDVATDASIETIDEATAISIAEISRYMKGLRDLKILSEHQAILLEELLAENSTLLLAAYSIAVSADDSEYFAQICAELAQTLETEQGRSACSAQDEVLQVCDQLFEKNKVTEGQLLYLRHLVLTRDESVATIYDEYQESSNVQHMALSLHDLANTHPKNTEDEDDYEKNDESTVSLNGIVATMLRANMISTDEASVLSEIIAGENKYVLGAFDLYCQDGDMGELHDTLTRCAKLELRQRSAIDNEGNNNNNDDDDDCDDSDEDDGDGDDGGEDYSDEEDDDVNLEAILNALGVKNIWKEKVPRQFITAVFASSHRQLLTVDQARALCGLFASNNDMVLGAWKVYTIDGDVRDLLDSLKRVVRELLEEDNSNNNTTTSSTTNDKSVQNSSEVPASQTHAMNAIISAKRDLLKHSLEMMVKQNLCTENGAISLFQRALKGDHMVDAAIEAYASDRNVQNFLDTLQVLTKHSAEELEVMMRAASSAPPPPPQTTTRTDPPSPPKRSSPSPQSSPFKPTNDSSTAPTSSPVASTSTKQTPTLTASDQQSVVDILGRAGAITAKQTSLLNNLIISGDEITAAVFMQYEDDKDVYKLIDSLKMVERMNPDASDQYDDEEEDSEEEDSDDNEEKSVDDVPIEKKFLDIVQNMSLSHLETAALRLAIARDDSSIKSALDRFRQNLNDKELQETLRTISRRTINDTLQEGDEGRLNGQYSNEDNNSNDDDHDDDSDNSESGTHDSYNETDEQFMARYTEKYSKNTYDEDPENDECDDESVDESDDDDDESDDDDDESDDDDDESDDDCDEENEDSNNQTENPLTTQSARNHVFHILVTELVHENIIENASGAKLLQLFAAGHEGINTALDLYDKTGEMAELIDTLNDL
jgi:hypothetical protein